MSGDESKSFKPIEQVMAEIDAAPAAEREEIVERTRECLKQKNDIPTAEDEDIFRRFIEGRVTADDFSVRFGDRV